MEPCAEYFAKNLLEGSRRSAEQVIPLVLELVRPRSVIDVGCGTGSWLAVFQEAGVEEVLGVDGRWADRKMLEIPEEKFLVFDLKKPLRLKRRFDLVLSLEVAQHLPERCAATFVGSLTRLGPVVLFSAAIPFQGGHGHVNEQWPEYWVKHFARRGFEVIDCLRGKIWDNENVEWWITQNVLLFAESAIVESHRLLRSQRDGSRPGQLALVHPRSYLQMAERADRLARAAEDVATLVPAGEAFVLVDGGECDNLLGAGRRVFPFLNRNGEYWGEPPDDVTAIRELERLRRSGARFVVFAWPAFWWFDCYAEFYRYLRAKYRRALRNDCLVAFDLRGPKKGRVVPAGAVARTAGREERTHDC